MMMTPVPTFRGFLWRWTKRLFLRATLTALVVGAIVGFGLPALSRTSWARGRVEKALTRAFGTPVEVSSVAFTWKSGLSVKGISAPAGLRAEDVTIQPRYSKLLRGQLRARAVLDRPELMLPAGEISMHVPRLPKRGLRFEKIEIREGAINVAGSDRKIVRLRGLQLEGGARIEKRTLRIELASLSGDCEGQAFSGKGTLRADHDGVSGEVELKEAAAKESSSLQEALRALNLAPRKAPVLSEPF
jgi:hypothetical protein